MSNQNCKFCGCPPLGVMDGYFSDEVTFCCATAAKKSEERIAAEVRRENKRIARLAKQHHKDCIRLRGAAECNCQSLYDFAKKCRPKTVVGPRCFLKKHSLHSSGYITNRDYVDGE